MSNALAPKQRRAAVGGKRRLLSRGDNPLVRAVGHLPANVHTKLLIAFVGTSVLLVAVGLLGLRVLGQSNDRVASLGPLQERAFAYGQLQRDASHIRALLAEYPGRDLYKFWTGISHGERRDVVAVDKAVVNAVARFGPGTAADRLGFIPPPEDERSLVRMRLKAEHLSTLMPRIIELDLLPERGERWLILRQRAERLATDLYQEAAVLANGAIAQIDDLIARNASSYARSRNLFIGVAVGALVLALLLGFVLSWSVIGPIQGIDSRLAAIASGDFAGHVEVENRDELGALAANVNHMNDELRRLYTELEEASRHKSEFLANMSHELRTPLNAILGFSQVLRDEMFGGVNDKQAEYLDDILSSGQHLLSLINDVLDLSKVEAVQVELDVRPFSLREAVEGGVVVVREQASEDGIQVSFAADPDADMVEGDERRIKQVILNLLSNAVKFTPAGGKVDVSTTRVNGEVRISVTDTGPGIAASDRDRIFDEFQQTDAGVEQGEGTGLGLALSRRFVELHGGRIWVDTEPDAGSTFVFTLPAKAASS